jgi:predicted DNA-binding antitoxin AbrB/MazE fold protein
MKTKLSTLDEVIFEQKDVEIFKIKDIKTKISTLQNYFFPRLEFVVRDALQWVQDIYEVNPYEKMSFIHRPNNRKDAKENLVYPEVSLGISGKRRVDRLLKIRNKQGKPYNFHTALSGYTIFPEGKIEVGLYFGRYADKKYVETIKSLLKQHEKDLQAIFNECEVSYWGDVRLTSLSNCLKYDEDYTRFYFYSPTYHFPVDIHRGLHDLRIAFVALYPLLEATIDLAEGRKSKIELRLEKFKEWWLEPNDDNEELSNNTGTSVDDNLPIELPEMDSYKFVRAGLWWEVLARDKWTCKSCGRTSKDGVTLEVDHILPRSKGGTDEIKNLQTLCKKCNIGKSNKDDTDLR